MTTYQAGMAVPDWPTTYGYNPLLYPVGTWLAGCWDLFIEHGHRLLGILIGLQTIGVVIAIWRDESRRRLRGMALIALALVIAQGTLGGMRVLLDDRTLAQIHACVGPLFFAYCGALWMFTSPAAGVESPARGNENWPRIHRLCVVNLVLAYVQLIIGSFLRHVPLDMPPRSFRMVVVFHLVMVALLLIHTIWISLAVLRQGPIDSRMRILATGTPLLLFVQLGLGVSSWISLWGMPRWLVTAMGTMGERIAANLTIQQEGMLQSLVRTAHVAGGSLLLLMLVALAIKSRSLAGLNTRAASADSRWAWGQTA